MSDYVVGLDLGGTKIMTAVVDVAGHVVHKRFTLSEVSKGPDAVLERMAGAIHETVKGAGLAMTDVAAIGIGSPGPLDQDEGIVTDSPNMPGWKNVRVKDRIAKATGRRVFLDNDGNVGTLAEQAFGAGRGVDNLIGLFLGTGIGGGLIINGRLWHGFSKQAGELGHVV
ncbi:MAG TPA: ROK family protein, partial [Planctomycetota bacterium]|nr:ROK family protein [Planctomycetota bacterium]